MRDVKEFKAAVLNVEQVEACIKDNVPESVAADALCELIYEMNRRTISRDSGHYEIHFNDHGRVCLVEYRGKKKLAQNFKG